jgi:outer membrane protein OmpA-like peptidoglycan-associated protein
MFHSKLYGWTGVALGMLLGAGVANAATDSAGGSQDDQSMSSDDASGCREAGVTLTFGVGSTDINARGRTSLNGVAKWMKGDASRTVRVDGFTDKTGNAARNMELSEKRADSVKGYLVTKGIDPDKIATSGHGDTTTRPDLKNTRAVAVTACGPTKTAEAVPPPPPPEEKPAPEPAPVAETVPETPMPPPPVVVETPPPPPPPSPVIVMPAPVAPKKELPPSQIGLAMTLGAGATGFWQDGARAFVDTGGSWEARMVVGTRLPIAFEGAYIGSAQSIQTLGLSSDAILLGTGAEGDARINFTRSRIQPYIFGGAGWLNYQVRNTTIATSDLARSDNVLEVPFGIGVAARLGHSFLLDVRGTGRVVFDDTLLRNVAIAGNAGNPGLNSWNAGAHLGWEF